MAGQAHMLPARSDQDPVWKYGIPFFRLLDRYGAVPIESFGEDARKLRRHVLNNQNRWQRRNQQWEHLAKRLWATGRDADDETDRPGSSVSAGIDVAMIGGPGGRMECSATCTFF